MSLIELLIVLSIGLLMAALVIAGTGRLFQMQKEARARSQIQDIAFAITQYMADYGILGDEEVENPDDFAAAPAEFLFRRPVNANREPYLLLRPDTAGDIDGNPTSLEEAQTILDPWGMPFRVTVENARSGPGMPFDHTKTIRLLSTKGGDEDDPLVYYFDLDMDSWVWTNETE